MNETSGTAKRNTQALNANLIAVLKNAKGNWISESMAGRRAHLNGVMLERELDRLREAGYAVELSGTRLRLTSAPDLLLADEIRLRLDTSRIGYEVVVEKEVSSTNDVAWKYAEEGARDGFVVIAERQSSGRGRLGRSWHSPHGGLWMSIVLRPEFEEQDGFSRAAKTENEEQPELPALTIGASVSVARAVRMWPGCDATIKWPNDILLGGRKLAGLIVETRSTRDLRGIFILGIGINAAEGELPDDVRQMAASMAEYAAGPVLRADLACAVLRHFDDIYEQILQRRYAPLGEEWKRLSSTVGQRITIRQNSRTYTGEVVDLDPTAGLVVRLNRGFLRIFRGEHTTVVQ